MSNYLLAAKVLESSGRHPEALASILDATPACATFSLPLTVTILLPPRRGGEPGVELEQLALQSRASKLRRRLGLAKIDSVINVRVIET